MRHFIGGWFLGWVLMFVFMAYNGIRTKKSQTVNGSTMFAWGLIFGGLVWGLWP